MDVDRGVDAMVAVTQAASAVHATVEFVVNRRTVTSTETAAATVVAAVAKGIYALMIAVV